VIHEDYGVIDDYPRQHDDSDKRIDIKGNADQKMRPDDPNGREGE
jgi:hypothetical protein